MAKIRILGGENQNFSVDKVTSSHVSFYNSTATTWALATPRTNWESSQDIFSSHGYRITCPPPKYPSMDAQYYVIFLYPKSHNSHQSNVGICNALLLSQDRLGNQSRMIASNSYQLSLEDVEQIYINIYISRLGLIFCTITI